MGVDSGEMRELLKQWIEESQRLVGVLHAFLEECDGLQDRADMAERECDQLREEVTALRLEAEHSRKERAEIADSLSHFMSEVLSRLHRPAGLDPEVPDVLAEPGRTRHGGCLKITNSPIVRVIAQA